MVHGQIFSCTKVYTKGMKNLFGERLKELLQEKELSINKFAGALGVSPSIVSAWCRGLKQPTADNISAVAQFFGVTADYLLGLSDY